MNVHYMVCFNLDLFALFSKSAGEFSLCDVLCMRSYLILSVCSITNQKVSFSMSIMALC